MYNACPACKEIEHSYDTRTAPEPVEHKAVRVALAEACLCGASSGDAQLLAEAELALADAGIEARD